MPENNQSIYKQTLKTKARIILKRVLFNSDVSPISFRIGKDNLYNILRINKINTNYRTDFIKYLNNNYFSLNIRMLDIGSRSGLLDPYIFLIKLNNFYLEGIEPDKEEAKAILKEPNKYGPYKKVHTITLSDKEEKIFLYITKMLGCTSIYEPNFNNIKYYTTAPYYDLQKKIIVQATTLKNIFKNDEKFDFISLDVQGAEYKILNGGKDIFKNAIGISFEANFCKMYKKQRLFSDMHKLCLDNDFCLIFLDLSNLDGEITEAGNCVYIKKPELIKTKEDLLKRILFALLWQKKDYVEFLIRNFSNEILSPSEKMDILKKLNIKLKEKSSTKPDGVSAKNYEKGEGYYSQ